MTALDDTNPEALTDEEWRDFQSIPDQGYSHRHWVNWKIAGRVAALRGELADAQRRIDYLLTVPSNTHRDALTARTEAAEDERDAALAKLAALEAQPDWEYGEQSKYSEEVWLVDRDNTAMWDDIPSDRRVRRREAGPWEPVPDTRSNT